MFSYGLFARLSPDGRYAAATVWETSLFVMLLDHLDYSQLFYPATGRIAFYDRREKKWLCSLVRKESNQQRIEALNLKYPIQFDIFTLPLKIVLSVALQGCIIFSDH